MVHLDIAVALFAAQKFADSEIELDAVLSKAQRQPAALYWKYRCLKQRSDKDALLVGRVAADALVASVSNNLPDRGDLHYLLSDVAMDLGDTTRAEKHREIARRMGVTRTWPLAKKSDAIE